jgi:hypothetical protein
MKNLIAFVSIITLGALTTFGHAAEVPRSTAQVSLRVDAKTVRPEKVKKEKEDDDKKGKGKPKAETVSKTLDVDISAAKTIHGPLKMVTCWYARDITERKQSLAKKDETEVALDASKTAKVSVPACDFVSTPAHSQKGSDGKTEKVDASGQTFFGWVVRVYEGATLVGEAASSPPLLKLND